MASITIRNLDETAKRRLRERAARNGRSMEEEARLLIQELSVSRGADSKGATDGNERLHVALEEARSSGDSFAVNDYPAAGKKILLIIGGGIAAYKCLDLIRRLRERRVEVRAIMTKAAQEFITPLSVGALSAQKVFTDLFDREDEQDVGHIRLAREADLVLVAPATADLMAKMANGLVDDLASAVLLATRAPVVVAPAMNPAMWDHSATKRNLAVLKTDGIRIAGPAKGEMAEAGESGTGRMVDPMILVDLIGDLLDDRPKPLLGKRAVVTSGPTHETIDPVRYIANRSSGKQGHAIAAALAALGAEVILVSGPVTIPAPRDVALVEVESAREMLAAVEAALPTDIAVMVAAVADFRIARESPQKIKKNKGATPQPLELIENPDILKTIGHHKRRPSLVVGFAAETENLVKNAQAKLESKGADWIIANDVSPSSGVVGGVMGGDRNSISLLTRTGVVKWPEMSKLEVARRLAEAIAESLSPSRVEV
jgi:phosphopantothenoylcysteine decarboxylase/phosphopantothenate--cysteine ligase